MSTDLDSRHERKPSAAIDRLLSRAARRGAILKCNLATSRAFVARRRHDRRFRILPFNRFQIANATAVALGALALLILLFDPYLTVWQASLPEGAIAFFGELTEFGKSDWILIATGIFVILSALSDTSAIAARPRIRRTMRTFGALYVFLAVAIPGIIANLAKYVIGRARPKHFADSGSFSFDTWSGDASWASFPSGHATTALALGVALALLFPRLRWVFLSIGFWIAVSRLFTRAHYPSDVLAGCLLGGVGAWLIARAFARYRLVFGFDGRGLLFRRTAVTGPLT